MDRSRTKRSKITNLSKKDFITNLSVFKSLREAPSTRYEIKSQVNPEQFIGLDTETKKMVLINYRAILPETFEERVNEYKNNSLFKTIDSIDILRPEDMYIQTGFINHLVTVYGYINGYSLEKIRDQDSVFGSEYFWSIAKGILDASTAIIKAGYTVDIEPKDVFIADNCSWIWSGKFSLISPRDRGNLFESVEEVCRKLRNYKRERYTPPKNIIGYEDPEDTKIIEEFLDSLKNIKI